MAVPKHFCFLLLVLAGMTPLWGQDDGPVKMTPEFCFTVPLDQVGTDVSVKYPILMNPSTILKPGMKLRVLYILANHTDANSDLVLAHKGTTEQAYARDPGASTDGTAKLPSEVAHEIEGYRRTVWEVANNFVLAMAQYPTDSMHLIYQPVKDNRVLKDEIFSFFDGMLVGLPGGKVTVLAVENDSKANAAGVKAGDEIVSIGGIPTKGDLATFASAYATTKHDAKVNEVSSYPMTIRPDGKGETRTVNISMPATLKGGLMNGL